jgi:uncharacterized protein YggE
MSAIQNSSNAMRVIKVQGKGRVSLVPDIVTLSFAVETQNADYAQCINALNYRTDELRKSTAAAGLQIADLKTSNFAVRSTTRLSNGERIHAGYAATHTLSIEISTGKDLLNRLLRHISRSHSGAELTLSFSVKDKAAVRKQALAQAVQTAKGNAEILAAAAGVALGSLQQIDYGWAEVRIYDRTASMLCEDAPSPVFAADIEPEDVVAEDTVTLVYEIRDL